ncbi:MAG: hypothetical protein U9N46_06435 [Euryarchaeota archaeon]|nr:MAG: hypothetical protein C5S47_00505 [ANME-2 cluster archaeon]MEA1864818.1 hypothetical protein [Euryarchaeota archaeon]
MAEKTKDEKEHAYRSMREFEERFFPRSVEDRLFETETDPVKLLILMDSVVFKRC